MQAARLLRASASLAATRTWLWTLKPLWRQAEHLLSKRRKDRFSSDKEADDLAAETLGKERSGSRREGSKAARNVENAV